MTDPNERPAWDDALADRLRSAPQRHGAAPLDLLHDLRLLSEARDANPDYPLTAEQQNAVATYRAYRENQKEKS